MWGCQVFESVSSNRSTTTPKECETDAAFVYIPSGKFIPGSDRAERDYSYQISAQAITKPGNDLAATEARLRKSRWFDRENKQQQISLPAVCISRNLVTNQEYQEFIIATKCKDVTPKFDSGACIVRQPPGISASDYQINRSSEKTYTWDNTSSQHLTRPSDFKLFGITHSPTPPILKQTLREIVIFVKYPY